jgi:GT2 family glycosyltransferase
MKHAVVGEGSLEGGGSTTGQKTANDRPAVVVIGRNEGERLRRCLASIPRDAVSVVVYVDSGSTDGSVALATAAGVHAVELDPSIAFTAARARNVGLAEVVRRAPDTELVQFVDGDCELAPGWINGAAQALRGLPRTAVVSGRLRERSRDLSIYNRLCDMEWAQLGGVGASCGGNMMARISAFVEVGGFNPALIAGEEPEMCVRLRRRDWEISRLTAEMGVHEAGITRFSQWWRRSLRAGHATAEARAMHGDDPENHAIRRVISNYLWGAAVPLIALVATARAGLDAGALALTGAWGALGWRVYASCRGQRVGRRDALLYSLFCVLGKLPQALGQALFEWRRLRRIAPKLIEYKRPSFQRR